MEDVTACKFHRRILWLKRVEKNSLIVFIDLFFLMIEYVPILVYFVNSFRSFPCTSRSPFPFRQPKGDPEKVSPYECGFDPFDDARSRFDIQFYLVAILFIIFDLEVTFLFPWALVLKKVGFFGFWSMMVFLFILTVGFVYEWRKGALDWG
jgi:NADH:ubiquinone oxidoreductase subunit 3 (subunit A)